MLPSRHAGTRAATSTERHGLRIGIDPTFIDLVRCGREYRDWAPSLIFENHDLPETKKNPRPCGRGLLLRQRKCAYRLTWRLLAARPRPPLETTLTHSASLAL